MKRELGGKRLGDGNKMNVELPDYGRSTHNLSRVVRTSLAPGTLVPFMTEIALNGDSWELDINTLTRTLPTVGPLFGSYKLQVDVFSAPVRLYNAQLHNNALGVGMKMQSVLFPKAKLPIKKLDFTAEGINEQQISQSSLLAYLGTRGLGKTDQEGLTKEVNAMPLLTYWDIYKNYYANKQEEVGAVIDTEVQYGESRLDLMYYESTSGEQGGSYYRQIEYKVGNIIDTTKPLFIVTSGAPSGKLWWGVRYIDSTNGGLSHDSIYGRFGDCWENVETIETTEVTLTNSNGEEYQTTRYRQKCTGFKFFNVSDADKFKNPTLIGTQEDTTKVGYFLDADKPIIKMTPKVEMFDLENLDNARELILQHEKETPLMIGDGEKIDFAPYSMTTEGTATGGIKAEYTMNGLALKTYQSDRFNNWLSTEWIDGDNGINAISAVDTSSGSFTMDSLILSKKVYNMLNRVAISGGSYTDWQEAIYGEYATGLPESPRYEGGASAEIDFNEVISTAETDGNPLGTLGGRGQERYSKGGKVKVKVKEPSIIMAIVSLTPRIDYSQGNKWWTRLENMNDLHKPALDGIGFQELITDEMVAWDTKVKKDNEHEYKSAGKQPSWIEYQTAVNETFGSFAEVGNEMFMTLNRRYEHDAEGNLVDLTTYIDPSKHNYAFALTRIDAQNFWVQLGVDAKVRRVMSAKVIPNL